MRTDAEREERAVWKLSEGGYTVRKAGEGYIVTDPDGTEMAPSDLAGLIKLAETVYERVWTGRTITRSA
jgi:hypothetical protein